MLENKLREDLERLKKIRAHRGLRHYWGYVINIYCIYSLSYENCHQHYLCAASEFADNTPRPLAVVDAQSVCRRRSKTPNRRTFSICPCFNDTQMFNTWFMQKKNSIFPYFYANYTKSASYWQGLNSDNIALKRFVIITKHRARYTFKNLHSTEKFITAAVKQR